jgi:uncharacterized protein
MKKSFRDSLAKATVRLGNGEVKAYLADSFLKRAIGLSFEKSLPENEGMLFVFPHPRQPAFWNLIMRFPIDVVWISDNRVIDIARNIPAVSGGIKVLTPPVEIDYALEIPAGLADKLGVVVGNAVKIIK